ncbi:hypothetical protein QBC41DRAFT_111048 [Cercophora samala]|uniref:C2H2-type domain-containing protein n=1 Tax=Cercophora samala TaxID=330535 RepID=A0AA39Y8Y0_9PEZI|nr:hypothetical protein QBC41DRAFT_111048 [Cercophora samala]
MPPTSSSKQPSLAHSGLTVSASDVEISRLQRRIRGFEHKVKTFEDAERRYKDEIEGLKYENSTLRNSLKIDDSDMYEHLADRADDKEPTPGPGPDRVTASMLIDIDARLYDLQQALTARLPKPSVLLITSSLSSISIEPTDGDFVVLPKQAVQAVRDAFVFDGAAVNKARPQGCEGTAIFSSAGPAFRSKPTAVRSQSPAPTPGKPRSPTSLTPATSSAPAAPGKPCPQPSTTPLPAQLPLTMPGKPCLQPSPAPSQSSSLPGTPGKPSSQPSDLPATPGTRSPSVAKPSSQPSSRMATPGTPCPRSLAPSPAGKPSSQPWPPSPSSTTSTLVASHSCKVCRASFSSRNRLFQHLQASGHTRAKMSTDITGTPVSPDWKSWRIKNTAWRGGNPVPGDLGQLFSMMASMLNGMAFPGPAG